MDIFQPFSIGHNIFDNASATIAETPKKKIKIRRKKVNAFGGGTGTKKGKKKPINTKNAKKEKLDSLVYALRNSKYVKKNGKC